MIMLAIYVYMILHVRSTLKAYMEVHKVIRKLPGVAAQRKWISDNRTCCMCLRKDEPD